jgi:YggT family protein
MRQGGPKRGLASSVAQAASAIASNSGLTGGSAGPLGILVMALAALLSKAIYAFTFALLIQVVASWVMPGARSPVFDLVDSLTEPLMRPLRAALPNLGALDLSPMVALMLLQLALMLIVSPLRDLGVSLL